jgi:hypothetical protein
MTTEYDQLQEKESYDVKYMSELREYWNAYSYALINEIFVGVGINLGLSEKEAYKLAKNRPGDLQKANFFKTIFEKTKNLFNHKIPKFRYKEKIYSKKSKQMTQKQWDKFSSYVDKFFMDHMTNVAEDIAVKTNLVGKTTTEFREKEKPYKNKSLFQVAKDQFSGKMPDNISEAYKKFDFDNAEKNSLNNQLSSIGMYVKDTSYKIQDAIRKQVQTGIENDKSPIEVASDLYWQVEKNESLVNKYTAESIRKDWNRIAATEMATVYENAILAPYEKQAMESMEDPKKAQYFVRTGGSCDWCKPRQGTIVRLVPSDVVVDHKNESLRSMGIKDPNTDIAIWSGKNNIGLKKSQFMIACPAHPYNTATFQPIDLENEWFNPKTGDIQKKAPEGKFIPKMKDYDTRTEEEKKEKKPHYIDSDRVQMNGSIYVAVSPENYNRELERSRKDPSLPIPINRNSPSYKRIFGEAEKYGI